MANNKKLKLASTLVLFLVLLTALKIIPSYTSANWQNIFGAVGFYESNDASRAPLSVHFIDVGQGDSIFIRSDFGSALIDSGEFGNAQRVLNYVRSYGVYKIDYVFISHYHSDHMGSMSDIIKGMEVENIVLPDIADDMLPTERNFEKLLGQIKLNKIKPVIARPNDMFNIGEVSIEVMGPFSKHEKMNNNSLVLKLTYKNVSFLLTGDAEIESEKELMDAGADLKSKVLKAGHHGSNTSSSTQFLKAVSPEIVVVTCGRDNPYGHPHKDFLKRTAKVGAKLLRTDYFGTVVVFTDGNSINYSLERVS